MITARRHNYLFKTKIGNMNLLHEFFNSASDASPLEAIEQEKLENEFQEWFDNRGFTEVVMPVIKYLAEKHHPHCAIIVTSTGAELVEGKESTGEITKFLRD